MTAEGARPPSVVIARGREFGRSFGASNQKAVCMARCLQAAGFRVYVLGGICGTAAGPSIFGFKRVNGIACYNPRVARAYGRLFGIFWAMLYSAKAVGFVWTMVRRRDCGHLILEEQPFVAALSLHLAGRLLRLPIIYNIEEWYAVHPGQPAIARQWALFSTRVRLAMSDAALVVSRYIADRVREINPRMRVHVLPPLASFSTAPRGGSRTTNLEAKTFLFCGSTAYDEVIRLIVGAFALISKRPGVGLDLILTGDPAVIARLRSEAAAFSGRFAVMANVPNAECICRMHSAYALLAPLRNTEQDTARIPQKIAEYASTGRPIITNAVGDVAVFFEDRKSAVFARAVTAEELAAAMLFLCEDPVNAEEIGRRGLEVGKAWLSLEAHHGSLGSFVRDTVVKPRELHARAR